jgi:hypothetical protein
MRIRTPIAGPADPRKGTVIITVLVVVVLLALAAYKYADMMSQEYHSAVTFVRAAQVRSYAWSGINWFMVAASSSDNINNNLGGNPFYSSSTLQDHQIQGSDGTATGYFSIASPGDPDNPPADNTSMPFGAICEAGKINVNAVMKMDPTGNTLYSLLMQLPNMTDDVANAIVDWLDQDDTPRSNGAESDYYSSLSPPYQTKNGYIDSLDELLLVRGVTPQLLYGADLNRNGLIDGNENDPNGYGAGWSTYLTVYSRELNVDSAGNPRVYVNDTVSNLYTNLQTLQSTVPTFTSDLISFIILYRTYGGTTTLPANTTAQPVSGYDVSSLVNQSSSSSSSSSSGSGSGSGGSSGSQISSLYDLINVYVAVPGKATTMTTTSNGKTTTVTQTPPPTYYASPLNDSTQLASLLPTVLDELTTSKSQYIWGRVNVNTASQTVLNALAAIGTNPSSSSSSSSTTSSSSSSGTGTGSTQNGLLQPTDVQNIIANRPPLYTSTTIDQSYQTPAWLITKASLTPATMKKIDQYITTRSQVYRVQSIGYQNANGPFARIEAVIDTNAGQPRLLMWRDLTELGKGFNWQMNGQ